MLLARFVPPLTLALFLIPILGLWLPWLGEARHVHYLYVLAILPLLFVSRNDAPVPIPRPWLVGLLGAFFLLSLAVGVSRFYQFEINGYDFSVFDQMFSQTARGNIMHSPIYDLNHLGVHTSWLFFLIYPAHALFESPLFLLTLGAVLHTVAALPLYALCKRQGHADAAAVLFCVTLLTCPALADLSNDGFRLESYLPFLLLMYIYAVIEGSRLLKFGMLALVLLAKEDMALYVAGLALYGSLFGQDKVFHRIALVAAVLFFAVNTMVMQPLLLDGVKLQTMGYWQEFGNNPKEVVISYLTHPIKVLSAIGQSGWWNLYLPLLALPLLHPPFALMAAPGILILGTATTGAYLYNFSGYPIVPLVCISLAALVTITESPLLQTARVSPQNLKRLSYALVVVFPLWNVGWLQVVPWPDHRMNQVAEFTRQLEQTVPGEPICTQAALFPHLGYRLDLKELTKDCLEDPKATLALAPKLDPFPFTAEKLSARAEKARLNGRASVVVGDFLLIRP